METIWIPLCGYFIAVVVFFVLYQWRANASHARDKLPAFGGGYYRLKRLDKRLTIWMSVVGVIIVGLAIWAMVSAYLYGQTGVVMGCGNG